MTPQWGAPGRRRHRAGCGVGTQSVGGSAWCDPAELDAAVPPSSSLEAGQNPHPEPLLCSCEPHLPGRPFRYPLWTMLDLQFAVGPAGPPTAVGAGAPASALGGGHPQTILPRGLQGQQSPPSRGGGQRRKKMPLPLPAWFVLPENPLAPNISLGGAQLAFLPLPGTAMSTLGSAEPRQGPCMLRGDPGVPWVERAHMARRRCSQDDDPEDTTVG